MQELFRSRDLEFTSNLRQHKSASESRVIAQLHNETYATNLRKKAGCTEQIRHVGLQHRQR